jgi:hypothetical protein
LGYIEIFSIPKTSGGPQHIVPAIFLVEIGEVNVRIRNPKNFAAVRRIA